jgi:hypothetical protein
MGFSLSVFQSTPVVADGRCVALNHQVFAVLVVSIHACALAWN